MNSPSLGGAVANIDDLLKEYLVFRGFTNTLRTFEAEIKTDKDKGFNVAKITEQIFVYINTHDIVNLRRLWNHLEKRFLRRLDQSFLATVRKLELSLMRHYVIYA
eukprot:Colp12_sorted_trinity150504_noHs@27472